MIRSLVVCLAAVFASNLAFAQDQTVAKPADQPAAKAVDIGTQAPDFKIKDSAGKEIDLAALTSKGPVLVRLTCGCSGCDKELTSRAESRH